jgi:hypothetical protein
MRPSITERLIVEKIILYRPDNRLVIIFHDF